MANFGPLQNKTPRPIVKKIVIVDYVHEMNRYANLGANPSMGASGKIGEI